jgi:hypothetical protein
MLNVIMLNVANKPFMLSVIMLNTKNATLSIMTVLLCRLSQISPLC